MPADQTPASEAHADQKITRAANRAAVSQLCRVRSIDRDGLFDSLASSVGSARLAQEMLTRRALIRLENFPLVRTLGVWRADWTFRRWLRRNPSKSFADFYVNRNEKRVRLGRPHPTLGNLGYVKGQGKRILWDQDNFSERGLDNWQQFLQFGLLPHMRCVDYGCGSLRLGQHAIRYLNPGSFWGVDVSASFMEAGLELLGAEVIAEKRPKLTLIDPQRIEEIGRWAPDFILSNAVLQHVPEDEIPLFFERLAGMMSENGKAVIIFVEGKRTTRIKATSWAYPPALLKRIAEDVCPQFTVSFFPASCDYQSVAGGNRSVMVLDQPTTSRSK